MAVGPNPRPGEAERAEFERVLEALAKWPRLSKLLQYMGEKLFAGEVEQINEYNIATGVLGRSKTQFNAGDDAIARVETHRLRRRLTEFYENEGKDHPIRVSIPPGSYVPSFIHNPEGRSTESPFAAEPKPEPVAQPSTRPFVRLSRHWKSSVLAAGLLLAGLLGTYQYVRGRGSSARASSNVSPIADTSSASIKPGGSPSTIRLLAGYSGPPRTDSAGKVWNPDQYFSGGGTWQRSPGFISRTSDPFLFEHMRTGDFSYSIPLEPGIYELHLYFSAQGRSDAMATFNGWINGQQVLQAFDINADALGENVADERVFRDVSPEKDGFLHMTFSGAMAPPALNAIEILPGIPHAQLPIRLVMQSSPVTDRRGQLWHPDNYFMNGIPSTEGHPLSNSPDPDLFSEERFGHFTYAIPVDTRDTYTLILHFAEFYYGSGASGTGGTGSRIFKVMCNGQTLLDNFDIFKETGNLKEIAKTFHHLKPSSQGKLNLTFEPIANNATISGIEVLDEFQ